MCALSCIHPEATKLLKLDIQQTSPHWLYKSLFMIVSWSAPGQQILAHLAQKSTEDTTTCFPFEENIIVVRVIFILLKDKTCSSMFIYELPYFSDPSKAKT